MRNAIIVHGKPDREEYYDPHFPSASNSHWLPYLQKQLLIHDIAAHTLEIPHAYRPEYSIWRHEYERYEITSETLLVGHSAGGGFLLRWLSENRDIRVDKIVLVAPWLDPFNELETGFFDFTLDSELASRTRGVVIFNSDDDYETIQLSVKNIRDNVTNVRYREFHNYGHFCAEDMGPEFPELVDELLK